MRILENSLRLSIRGQIYLRESLATITKIKTIMPTDLIHSIGIAAATETIYRAITTEDGI